MILYLYYIATYHTCQELFFLSRYCFKELHHDIMMNIRKGNLFSYIIYKVSQKKGSVSN